MIQFFKIPIASDVAREVRKLVSSVEQADRDEIQDARLDALEEAVRQNKEIYSRDLEDIAEQISDDWMNECPDK